MKKFYSVLALAAAACLTAQAADVKPAAVAVQKAVELDLNQVVAPAFKAPAKAKATTMEELQGLYPGTTMYPFDSYPDPVAVDGAVVPTTGNEVLVFGITDVPLPGTVDFAAGTISLPGSYDLGQKNFGGAVGKKQVILKHFTRNSDNKWAENSNNPYILKITEDGLYGEDLYLGEIQGYDSYMVTGGYKFQLSKTEEENPAQWHTTGEATFTDDGWFLPWFNWEGMQLQVPTLTCQFQRSSASEDVVALYNLYGGLNDWLHQQGAQFDLIEGNLPARVVINISNKKCVYVPYTYVAACDELFYGSDTSAESIANGDTPEDLLDFLGEENLSSYDEANKIITIKNCLVTSGNYRNKKYSDLYVQWGLSADQVTNTVTIMLPEVESGIKNITVDANAPVEYFNLQGIRVENPTKGLYIKRQGNTATKVIL